METRTGGDVLGRRARRAARLALSIALFALLAGAAVGCGDGKAPSTDDRAQRSGFMDACTQDGEDQAYCGCLYDGFRRELTPEQIRLFVKYLDEGDASKLPKPVLEAFWRVDEACLRSR